jgi:hypothetical protein
MEDIFDEAGALTAEFLAARGYCCGLECTNCPYVPRHGGLEAVLPPDADTDHTMNTPAEEA